MDGSCWEGRLIEGWLSTLMDWKLAGGPHQKTDAYGWFVFASGGFINVLVQTAAHFFYFPSLP